MALLFFSFLNLGTSRNLAPRPGLAEVSRGSCAQKRGGAAFVRGHERRTARELEACHLLVRRVEVEPGKVRQAAQALAQAVECAVQLLLLGHVQHLHNARTRSVHGGRGGDSDLA